MRRNMLLLFVVGLTVAEPKISVGTPSKAEEALAKLKRAFCDGNPRAELEEKMDAVEVADEDPAEAKLVKKLDDLTEDELKLQPPEVQEKVKRMKLGQKVAGMVLTISLFRCGGKMPDTKGKAQLVLKLPTIVCSLKNLPVTLKEANTVITESKDVLFPAVSTRSTEIFPEWPTFPEMAQSLISHYGELCGKIDARLLHREIEPPKKTELKIPPLTGEQREKLVLIFCKGNVIKNLVDKLKEEAFSLLVKKPKDKKEKRKFEAKRRSIIGLIKSLLRVYKTECENEKPSFKEELEGLKEKERITLESVLCNKPDLVVFLDEAKKGFLSIAEKTVNEAQRAMLKKLVLPDVIFSLDALIRDVCPPPAPGAGPPENS